MLDKTSRNRDLSECWRRTLAAVIRAAWPNKRAAANRLLERLHKFVAKAPVTVTIGVRRLRGPFLVIGVPAARAFTSRNVRRSEDTF
jgi:hypothetical protein